MPSLLAVDVGVRTGLAAFGEDGRLRWYSSHNLGNASRLRRAAPQVLAEVPDLALLVVEGGGPLADVWAREAERRGVPARQVDAQTWRETILYPRERSGTAAAKGAADILARRVIAWSGAPGPSSLRHDAAEAILVGLWAAVQAGWLERVPPEVRR